MSRFWKYVIFITLLSSCSESPSVDLPEKVDAVLKEERLSPKYFEGLDHLVNSNNQLEEAWGLYLRARDLVVQGASVASLPMIERSEILFRANGNNAGLSKILLLKAHSYWALGSGEEILSTSEEAMALRQDDALAWATAAGNYSTYLIDFGYYQEALEYSDTVLSIFKSMHGKINPSEAYAVRAEAVYQLNRDPLEADTLIQASMALVDDDRVVDIDKQNIYFRALGMAALSQEQIAECIRFAHQREYWSLEAEARSQLANYNLLGETKDEALNAEIMANKLALQRVDESQSKFLAFELDRGKRERLRFEEAARLRQQTLLIFLSMALVVIIGVWISYRSILKTKEAQFDVQEAQLELESYKNRIRPHFLFNQLNNVNGFLNQERLQEAQEYLAELSQFLRSLLYDQNSNLVQFQYEVRHLEKYASLQQQSSYGHVNFTVNVSDELLKSKIPSGILQPLVENSFKYAGNSSLPEPWVKVSACQIGPSQLEIRVEDSGFGSMERVPGTGNGLTLVKNRIAFNKGRSSFPKLWEIETNFGKRKSTVKLTMPSKLV